MVFIEKRVKIASDVGLAKKNDRKVFKTLNGYKNKKPSRGGGFLNPM